MDEIQNSLLKFSTEISIAVLSVIAPFLAKKAKTYLLKKKKEWFDKTHANQWSREVFESIVELRMNTKADRAYVLLRSNGTSYYNGLKGDHLTMVYESLDHGVSAMLPLAQKVPAHFMEDSVTICDKEGQLKVITDKLHDGSYFKADLQTHGTKVGYCVPMRKCPNSIPEGYVGLCYLDEPIELDEKIFEHLKYHAARVGQLLRVKK